MKQGSGLKKKCLGILFLQAVLLIVLPDLFKVSKMTNFNYDLFKVSKMTNFNYDLFKVAKRLILIITIKIILLYVFFEIGFFFIVNAYVYIPMVLFLWSKIAINFQKWVYRAMVDIICLGFWG